VSFHEYEESKTICYGGKVEPSFYSLLMAAMRRADTGNALRLQLAFPEVWEELQARYNAPGGKLPEDAS